LCRTGAEIRDIDLKAANISGIRTPIAWKMDRVSLIVMGQTLGRATGSLLNTRRLLKNSYIRAGLDARFGRLVDLAKLGGDSL
jgi:hypothetical protein